VVPLVPNARRLLFQANLRRKIFKAFSQAEAFALKISDSGPEKLMGAGSHPLWQCGGRSFAA
jgi:hypothetical protein